MPTIEDENLDGEIYTVGAIVELVKKLDELTAKTLENTQTSSGTALFSSAGQNVGVHRTENDEIDKAIEEIKKAFRNIDSRSKDFLHDPDGEMKAREAVTLARIMLKLSSEQYPYKDTFKPFLDDLTKPQQEKAAETRNKPE